MCDTAHNSLPAAALSVPQIYQGIRVQLSSCGKLIVPSTVFSKVASMARHLCLVYLPYRLTPDFPHVGMGIGVPLMSSSAKHLFPEVSALNCKWSTNPFWAYCTKYFLNSGVHLYFQQIVVTLPQYIRQYSRLWVFHTENPVRTLPIPWMLTGERDPTTPIKKMNIAWRQQQGRTA